MVAKIAEMPAADRALAKKLHAIVKASAPDLAPRLWYGMPAYARDGKVVCFFQGAHKFKTRYATFGFSDRANVDQRRRVAGRVRGDEADSRRREEDRRAREESRSLTNQPSAGCTPERAGTRSNPATPRAVSRTRRIAVRTAAGFAGREDEVPERPRNQGVRRPLDRPEHVGMRAEHDRRPRAERCRGEHPLTRVRRGAQLDAPVEEHDDDVARPLRVAHVGGDRARHRRVRCPATTGLRRSRPGRCPSSRGTRCAGRRRRTMPAAARPRGAPPPTVAMPARRAAASVSANADGAVVDCVVVRDGEDVEAGVVTGSAQQRRRAAEVVLLAGSRRAASGDRPFEVPRRQVGASQLRSHARPRVRSAQRLDRRPDRLARRDVAHRVEHDRAHEQRPDADADASDDEADPMTAGGRRSHAQREPSVRPRRRRADPDGSLTRVEAPRRGWDSRALTPKGRRARPRHPAARARTWRGGHP